VRLIQRVVANPRRGSVLDGVERLSAIAAAHRERLTALVTAVVPLTEAQRERLTRSWPAATASRSGSTSSSTRR
jgi:F-type H+-transporting ATPase subunit delta